MFSTRFFSDFCSNPFGDYCYELDDVSFYNESGARSSCQLSCGDLVSIHSEEENLHVLSLTNSSSSSRVRIGARTDGTVKYWVDETAFDFSNFEYFNADIGKCSTMQISAATISSGQWSSASCEDTLPYICKTKQGVYSCPSSVPRT
ncbi:hypothetical protein GCK72_019866 [Caenorhabditis remanei]|uniref:C-type lectin domain-containing protein n=1 Tax=Caenorhabditis remanei TaxID=31234 RepID=E3LJC6_CAERE|nr:hypothetical protein GCK72_019866 [Caenorhabditis remanei]EFO95625.1 hypothetical protein CRE_08680 [Caenorhabditis remanei]KAF1753310.1 hypothetical protein GCK72_019866 [Caenorhabditis remanei]